MIALMIFLLGLLWLVMFRFKRRRMYELASRIPEFSGKIPILGSVHHFVGSTKKIMSSIQSLSQECIKMGGIVTLWQGHMLNFWITNPSVAEYVLRFNVEKDDLLRFFVKIFGNGIIFAPAPIWKIRRRNMMPLFTPRVVETFADSIINHNNKLAEKLQSYCGKGTFCVGPLINRYVFMSVCEIALGMNINVEEDSPFLTVFKRAMNLGCERYFHIWLHPDSMYRLFRSRYIQHEECRRFAQEYLDEIISQRRKDIEATRKSDSDENLMQSNKKVQTFLDLLIKTSGGDKGYSDVELKEEIMSIIYAASDTTTISIANTLVLLKKYPKVQEKVNEELQRVFKNSEQSMVKEDILQLKYLDRVVKESMRLFPPVPVVSRKILKETKLPSGYILPAGSIGMVSIWGIHRDRNYWGPDADCFDPDRFLPERTQRAHPCSYMPFGFGSRNCIGGLYALFAVKASLVAILRRYKVIGVPEKEPAPHIEMKFEITMKAVDDWQLELEKK